MQLNHFSGEEGKKYVKLDDLNNELHIEIKSVEHTSRVHLDIETDNIEAEISRLEKLGAKKIALIKSWCVMVAPIGQRFCIVRQCTGGFDKKSNEWN